MDNLEKDLELNERTKVEISLNINQTVEETLVDTESITEVSSGESACRVEKEEGYSYIQGSVYGGGNGSTAVVHGNTYIDIEESLKTAALNFFPAEGVWFSSCFKRPTELKMIKEYLEKQ